MKFFLSFILSFCFHYMAISQQNNGSKNKTVGGMVAYYFWEESDDETIQMQLINQPFKRNHTVEIGLKKQRQSLDLFEVKYSIASIIEKTNSKKHGKHFEYKSDSVHVNKFKLPIIAHQCNLLSSVIVCKKHDKWTSKVEKQVLYFYHFADSSAKFIKSSDSIELVNCENKTLATNHYVIHSYLNAKFEIVKQQILNYNMMDVSASYFHPKAQVPSRFLVFSNGYRGPNKNNDKTDNLVTSNDRFGYWLGIDKAFKSRLEPNESFYIDGNQTIRTSGHKSMIKFGLRMVSVQIFAQIGCKKMLNSKPNLKGFNERRELGKIAANAFLIAKCNSFDCTQTIDTVDIVCHSMGYSYALGFIDELKDKVIFGNFYILAPESAAVGGADWTLFKEIWQYGTNLGQPNSDPVWQQDGIAPQSPVLGIETLPADEGGRVFFPDYWPIKNFIDSHMLYNYMWIFDNISKGERGYIHK